MFPVRVSERCPTVESIPMVPIVVMLVLFVALIPWVESHLSEREDHSGPHSISWTFRSIAGKIGGALIVVGVLIYTGLCLGQDPVALALILTGLILLVVVICVNGQPESYDPLEDKLTKAHKFWAFVIFAFLVVVACLITYYFSQLGPRFSDLTSDQQTRVVFAYVAMAMVALSFVVMAVTIMTSEDHWDDVTSVFEWMLGGFAMVIIGVVPGQIVVS